MVDPACYVITASEWEQLVTALAYLALLLPVAGWLVSIDWWRVEDRFRVCRRRRRIRAIRKARHG